jgi:inner membrane protein
LEPLTHFLTGACLSRAGLNRKTGLATLTLVLAAEAPDVDIAGLAGGSLSYFQHHRGFTHTLLGAPFVAALALVVVYAIYRIMQWRGRGTKVPVNWKVLYLYALMSAFLHIFLDFMNSYGVRPFAPFLPRWYSWDIVSLIDPTMLLVLFLGLVTPSLLGLITDEVGVKKQQFRGRGGAWFALTCLVLVIVARDIGHRRALSAMQSVEYRNQEAIRLSAFAPRMTVNPFAWTGVVETQNFFAVMRVDSLSGEVDTQNKMLIRYKPEETPVTLAAKNSRLGRVFLDWAQYPIVETEPVMSSRGYQVITGYQVQFVDLRFTSLDAPRDSTPLAGYVLLDPKLNVEDMSMNRPIVQDKVPATR